MSMFSSVCSVPSVVSKIEDLKLVSNVLSGEPLF